MAKIEKRIVIEKSSERIFNYVAEPLALPQVWPGLLEVREVQRAPDGLAFARWLYKLMGPLIEEWIIAAKFEADQRAFTGELCGHGAHGSLSSPKDPSRRGSATSTIRAGSSRSRLGGGPP